MTYSFTPASPTSVLAFLAVVVGVLAATLVGLFVAGRNAGEPAGVTRSRALKFIAGVLIYQAAVAALVMSGWIGAAIMPRVMIFLAACNLIGVTFALSPAGRLLGRHLPIAALVGFQAFRLPLELVLHSWGEQGTIPMTMTWSGQNLDVITGIVALAAAPFAGKSRAAAWAANLIGIVLLANVARVALMSAPLPFSWPDVMPPLLLPLYMPYALIVPVCVAGALAGHVILTKRLLSAA